jgi:hypothetical protein
MLRAVTIATPRTLSLPGLTGQSSNPCAIDVSEPSPHREPGGYWIARSSRAMTIVEGRHDAPALTRTPASPSVRGRGSARGRRACPRPCSRSPNSACGNQPRHRRRRAPHGVGEGLPRGSACRGVDAVALGDQRSRLLQQSRGALTVTTNRWIIYFNGVRTTVNLTWICGSCT